MTEFPAHWGDPHSRTIAWFDLQSGRAGSEGLTGIEYAQGIVDGRFAPPPSASFLGSRLTAVSKGEAVFRWVPDESFLNPLGLVHGGFVSAVMDSAMGVAVLTKSPPGTGYASIEFKVSFLKPVVADGREFEVRGRALRVGRRIAFAEAHAFSPDGELAAHSTSSLAAVTPVSA